MIDNVVLHEMAMVNLIFFSSKTTSKESRLFAQIIRKHFQVTFITACCMLKIILCCRKHIFFDLHTKTCQFLREREKQVGFSKVQKVLP